MKLVKHLFINGPAGKLQAIFNPAEDAKFLAVVCHPHPQFQGTMHNKVVVSTARTLGDLGGAVVRFNFRGVMESEGIYDGGIGEEDDMRAAMEFILNEYPQTRVPLVAAGFSFGAWVGLKVGATDRRVSALIGLGLPVRMFKTEMLHTCTKPKLLIYGDRDEFNPLEKLLPELEKVSEPKEVHIVSQADHFFAGKLEEMNRLIETWMRSTLGFASAG
ncbi:MAG: alpha/beta hydrolase [Rhizobacter sp.]|nr:alpha/beta hydrolase [Chlorobiales bacterium]